MPPVRRRAARRVRLGGRRRFDQQRSDVDFIATFAPHDPRSSLAARFFGFGDALERLLGRPVDLLTDQPIRNRFLRRAVDASRREFYVGTTAEAP